MNIQNARASCYRAERESRGIPGESDGYVDWFEAHRGTPEQLAWSRAYAECRRRYTQPGGMWNTATLIYLGAQ